MVLYAKLYPADRYGYSIEDLTGPPPRGFDDLSDIELADAARILVEGGADLVGFLVEYADYGMTPAEALVRFCETYS